MIHRPLVRLIAALVLLLTGGALAGCQGGTGTPLPAPTATPAPEATHTPSATPAAQPTVTPSPTASPAPETTVPRPPRPATPDVVRAKIEIVWPHGGVGVEEADLANITAYLLAGDGTAPAPALLDSPPCDWSPTVRLWSALNNEPMQQVSAGEKRMVTAAGRTFPVWDFNDVDVQPARDPANKLAFFVTVDGMTTLSNVWAHAADARTLFPQQSNPMGAIRHRPAAADARIQIVWPKDGQPVESAQAANITVYLFEAGTMQAIAPDAGWSPAVRLHWSTGNEAEAAPGQGMLGAPRSVSGANGVTFLAWDFNDVDVSAANDSLNRVFFWVTVDGVTTYSNIWAHAIDARTLFPQPEVLNSCK